MCQLLFLHRQNSISFDKLTFYTFSEVVLSVFFSVSLYLVEQHLALPDQPPEFWTTVPALDESPAKLIIILWKVRKHSGSKGVDMRANLNLCLLQILWIILQIKSFLRLDLYVYVDKLSADDTVNCQNSSANVIIPLDYICLYCNLRTIMAQSETLIADIFYHQHTACNLKQ